MPKSLKAMATLAVVRRDHFRPVMDRRRYVFEQEFDQCDDVGRFFFRRLASATGAARTPGGRYILIQQLLTAAGNRVRIQAEKLGQCGVAAMPEFDGFETGEEATLLLVQQTVEQKNGGLEFLGGQAANLARWKSS